MYEEDFYGMNIGERLVCVKGYTHPNMGTVCRKGQKYKVNGRQVMTDGDTEYAVGKIKDNSGIWMCTRFIAEHFVKEDK